MAPEQIAGEGVDARTDLYALGCILYELLTGRPPFGGKSVPETIQGHLNETPVAPSTLAEVSPKLEELVLAMLAKKPRQRPGHADAVAAALGLMGARDGMAGAPAPKAYLYRPRLAGRNEALQELHEMLNRLQQNRSGLLLIGGESGVGKTLVAMELARTARERGIRVLIGQGVSLSSVDQDAKVRGGAPLQTLRPVLQAIADRCRERGAEENRTAARAAGKRSCELRANAIGTPRTGGPPQCFGAAGGGRASTAASVFARDLRGSGRGQAAAPHPRRFAMG
jgi:hypothetical protein